MRHTRALVAAIAFVASAIASGRADTSTLVAAPLRVAMGSPIAYRVAWDWRGATWDEAARAYSFRTDRGYDVTLTHARVGLAELELVPCPVESLGASLGAWLAPRSAYANHGGVHDRSLVAGAIAESPLDAPPRAFGVGLASGRAYCRVHALLAPLESTDGASVSLRGSLAVPGERIPRVLDARVGLAGGSLVDLRVDDRLALSVDDRSIAIRVVLRRDAARALDGADLAHLTSGEIAYAFLRGLARATTAVAEADGAP